MPGMVPREELLVPLALRQALGEPVSLAFPSLQGPAEGSGGPAPSWACPSWATFAEPGPGLLVPGGVGRSFPVTVAEAIPSCPMGSSDRLVSLCLSPTPTCLWTCP